MVLFKCGGGGATRPLPKDGGVVELHEDPTVGLSPKDQRSKMEEVMLKMARRRGSNSGQLRKR